MIESQYCANFVSAGSARACGRTTYLVDHHDGHKIASRRKEQTIQVVADGRANWRAESIQDDLTHDEEEDTESDIPERPPILKGPDHQQYLQRYVHHQLHGVEDVQHHKQPDGVGRPKSCPRPEGGEGDEERDGEGGDRADTHHPQRERSPVLIELEADEAVDQEARYHGRRQAVLN